MQGINWFRQITEMHRSLGVDLIMCVAFLEAVFQAVAHRLGRKATAEVLACWSCQLLFISRAMGEAFRELSSLDEAKVANPQLDVTGNDVSSNVSSKATSHAWISSDMGDVSCCASEASIEGT